MVFLIGLAAKGIGNGIGLASEAIAANKEKKAAKKAGLTPVMSPTDDDTKAIEPVVLEHKSDHGGDSSSSDEEDLNQDKADWALDEAAREMDGPPAYQESTTHSTASPDDMAKTFLSQHQLAISTPIRPLPQPVILPQRRPKDKSRGFVRAYAPLLGECSGIDQATFIDFLNDLDKSSKASPIFDVINIACFAVGFVPNPIAMGVSIAVQVANQTAQEVQSRHRRNTYLDQINETLFKPRGLYCMLMTFKPDNPDDPVLGMDISPHDQALAKTLSVPDSQFRQQLKKLRLTSGTTKGEMSLPPSAPLVYPALDAAYEAQVNSNGTAIPESKQEAVKASGGFFLAPYFDRRAQAKYAALHPESQLAQVPQEKQFASRFSDPNHPASSGSIVSLITGGHVNPLAGKRIRKAERRAWIRGVQLTEQEKQAAALGRREGKNKGLIGRTLAKNVLYLAVVNLPSEAEMAEIRQELARVKSSSSH